ncbi:MAG: succinate dehydrogenase, hydrophobic membrane anchor protein [Rhodospirillaceae bacterium]|nr:succinate dehydrogenase, hydrophobic membrane anchor protein [Rhodospirillaceae bacterium]|tara:strand:+ start:212 stop:592 length:381 start_codon:yes stop_codon:yes gene_type:complete
MKSMRSPLGRARGLGSAKTGTDHWWAQRLTALALVPLTIWFVVSMILVTGADYAAAVDFISSPINAVLLILLIVATFHHGQLGLQVVIEDYIHTKWLEVGLIIAVKGLAIFLGVASVYAVIAIALK